MSEFRTYGCHTPEESERERKHRLLARKAASEGMVLLKNDGMLPLMDRRIALYGAGARMTVRGGTGSGDTHERYSVSIEQGLENAGFELVNTRWIDRFDMDYAAGKKLWRDGIEEKIKDYTMENVLDMFQEVYSIPLKFPIGEKIEEGEFAEGVSTAIYVVARQAGEGADRRVEPGDFLLDEVEVYNIRALAKRYEKFLLVINCGGMLDLSQLDDVENIGAILFFGQGGTEGGNAFADLITGKVTPSGKLTDTWAIQYGDYPSADTFGHRNGDLANEAYQEGIYVGYRYFDSSRKQVRYPFGYGLSYTGFAREIAAVSTFESTVMIQVKVTNSGDTYVGKDVVQLYLERPQGRLDHEKRSLVAFSKTKELAPKESCIMKLSFDLRETASYDQHAGEWILEKGEHGLYMGASSRENQLVAVLVFNQEIITEKTEPVSPMKAGFTDWKPEPEHISYPQGISRYIIQPEVFLTREHFYQKPAVKVTDKIKKLIDTLSVQELAALCVGGGQFGKTYHMTPGAVGWTTMDLIEKGVPNVNFSDGPAGLNLTVESVIEEDGTNKYLNKVPENLQWGFLKEMGSYALGNPKSGTPIYQYMTAWPAIHVQAQTWNVELVREIGIAVGQEMLETGVTLWLAPAMNIHRNPLCGRNFEYYSEDSFLSGAMAAAVTEGVQSFPGIGVTVKHFCCNNQEDNRNYVSENVSERALRELYLRGFRYVVEHARPKAIMSSYNKVNGEYVANSYDLLTKVLRNEWEYQGLVMSDWGAAGEDKASYVKCPAAGNDLIMPGNPEVVPALVKAVEDGELSIQELKWCASHVLTLIYDSAVVQDEIELGGEKV